MISRRRKLSGRDVADPNWAPSDEDVANAATVRPLITTADMYLGPAVNNPDPDPVVDRTSTVSGQSIAARSENAPGRVIYGNCLVGGDIVFFTADQGLVGDYIHLIVAIACHQIEAVDELRLDGRTVTFGGGGIHPEPGWGSGDWANLVFMSVNLGADDQVANSDIVGQSEALFPGKWTAEHRLRGWAYAYIILNRSAFQFPNGFPKIQFIVRGRNEIYDPRDGLYKYTTNAPLCIADYYTNDRFGCRAETATEVHEQDLIDCADDGDDDIGIVGGGTQKRWTLNGSFTVDQNPRTILSQMITTIGGVEYTAIIQGSLRLFGAKWREPVLDLDENDIRSDLRLRVLGSRRDTFNQVTGTYISSENDFAEMDFPIVKNQLYLDEDDGEPNPLDVPFPFTIFGPTAQRLGKILLEDVRQPMIVDVVCSLRAMQLQYGDVIRLNFSRFGWINKYFRVIHFDIALDNVNGVPSIGIALILKETASGIYDWNDGEETVVDIAPNTYLPDPTLVTAPVLANPESGTDVLYKRADGTIFSRVKLSWTSADPFVSTSGHHEIQYKKSSDSDWQDAAAVPGTSTSTFILDVQDRQTYDFRVRSVNGLGFVSDWSTQFGYDVIGKSAPPADVSGFALAVQAYGGVLSWNDISDIDKDHYEVREGTTWSTATVIDDDIRGTQLPVYFRSAGTHTFLIRAFDTSGNQSLIPTATSATVTPPDRPNGTFAIIGPTVVLDWEPVNSQFALDRYRVSYGATYESSALIVETKSDIYTRNVDWGGLRSFYIVAIDVAGNLSEPLQIDVPIPSPGVVSTLRADVYDNNALLKWDPPTSFLLPVNKYKLYRGDTFALADYLTSVDGTFATWFELIGGTFTYWVTAVDTAGNEGPPSPVSAKISEPRDFVFLFDQNVTPADFDTLSNVIVDGSSLVGPVVTGQTWADHFSSNGFTNIQDQIDAGYPRYIQPGATDGYAVKTIDFGVVVPASIIRLSYTSNEIDPPITIVPLIEWSLDGSSWSTADGTAVLASNFQYVRITLTFDGTDDTSLATVSDVRVRLDVRIDRLSGRTTANAGDADGTYVAFAVPVLDVRKITITPISETPTQFAVNFKDIPDPTGFNAKIWDEDGVRITREFTYDAEVVR